jgi:hypothetical protein
MFGGDAIQALDKNAAGTTRVEAEEATNLQGEMNRQAAARHILQVADVSAVDARGELATGRTSDAGGGRVCMQRDLVDASLDLLQSAGNQSWKKRKLYHMGSEEAGED